MSLLKEIDSRILDLIDKYSVSYKKEKTNKEKYEQYFTSISIAEFMAKTIKKINPKKIRILDPGCGFGVLSIAVIREIIIWEKPIECIELKLYEIDKTLINNIKKIFDELAEIILDLGITLNYTVINEEFISSSVKLIDINEIKAYDIVILNPPYGNLESNGKLDKNLKSIGIDVPNLYAAFVAISIKQLKEKGQLVAITPRSFCNGLYYTKFRKYLLENISIKRIHLFDSRESCFGNDEVLQEVIVYKLDRKKQSSTITISHSTNDKFDDCIVRNYNINKVVNFDDEHLFIKILKDKEDDEVYNIIDRMPCTLEDLGIQVSTGPVVDFRIASSLLTKEKILGSVPILYSDHFSDKGIMWPEESIKKKYNYIFPNNETINLLRPNATYVFVKRFSSKEEKKRIVSRVWTKELAKSYYSIGIENKLNYFHKEKRGIDTKLAIGLSKYLNSDIVDKWFRTVSGSTQVNVTDLKKLRYPRKEMLEELASLEDGTDIEKVLNGDL